MRSKVSRRDSERQNASTDDKKPTEVQINLTCPHCEGGIVVVITKEQLQLLRKGFRSKLSQAMRYWGRIRLKIGKAEPKR